LSKVPNLRVAGDPADIGHTCELVLGVDIEDVLDGQRGSEKVFGGSVDDNLWLSGGSRGLKMSRSTVSDCCWMEDKLPMLT
jgi:hypothetical protein